MTTPYTPFHSQPLPSDDTSTKQKWSTKSKRDANGSLLQIFRSRRSKNYSTTQRIIKNSNKTSSSSISKPPQPLLPANNNASAPDMAPLKDDDINAMPDDQLLNNNALVSSSSSSPDRSLMSGGTAASSLSSSDDYSPVSSKTNNKTYNAVSPPVNIYANDDDDDGGEAADHHLDDNTEENDWVDFPPQSSFLSSNADDVEQMLSSDDLGRIMSFTMTGDDANNEDADADARKCLFDNIDVNWDGFITDDDEPTTSSLLTIESLQTEVTQLTEELSQTKKRLESATITNEVLNEAHDKKHKELEQLNQDMDKFADIIMLCMQQLRERNVKVTLENEELKSSNKDMAVRLNTLTRCTEALNSAHDRKNEECEGLKRDMEKFAETFAAQHDTMEELEGRLRKVVSEREELLLQNNSSNKKELDVKVKSRRRSLRRRKKMERIDELSDDEDNKTD